MQHFKYAEFACRCGNCGSNGTEMNPRFLAKLDWLRELCDFPFIVTSGYRCPDHNEAVSSTGRNGPHTTGHAADILVMGEKAHRVLMMLGYKFTGVGIQQKGTHSKRFIHLDDLERPDHPRPNLWSY